MSGQSTSGQASGASRAQDGSAIASLDSQELLPRPQAENQCKSQADLNPEQSGVTGLSVSKTQAIAQAAQQYATGEIGLRDLAKQHNVCHRTMRVWMMRELGPEYAHIQEQALLMRIAEADDKLDEARDSVSIARAREQCRYARWDAERRLPQLLGQRPSTAIQVNGTGEMQVQIVSFARNNAVQQQPLDANPSQPDT